jgi:hypothetical protein
LDAGNRPTPAYDLLKNPATSKRAIADGVRSAYEPLFRSDEKANELSGYALKGLIAQVAGTDEAMTSRIAPTFTAVAKLADFTAGAPRKLEKAEEKKVDGGSGEGGGLRPEFHYNIQIHLPANGTEETYLNIFNALRRTFR